jgi:hypothetical protein
MLIKLSLPSTPSKPRFDQMIAQDDQHYEQLDHLQPEPAETGHDYDW